MNYASVRNPGFLLFAVFVAATAAPAFADDSASACPGYTRCPEVDFAKILATDPDALLEAREIAANEKIMLTASQQPGLILAEKKSVLGALLAFDVNLSVNRNQACFSCHTPMAGFTGGIAALNSTTATFPGSVTLRTLNRKPESAAYAAFAPVLYYSPSISDARHMTGLSRPPRENSEANFIGGNFFDSRATGLITGSPTADQAMEPPTNPLEMALPDHACAILRISRTQYSDFFRSTWGYDTLAISWPDGVDATCSKPNEGSSNQQPVRLSAADRQRAEASYIDMAKSIAAFEAGSFVSPFTSKFDAYLVGKAQLNNLEMIGLQLFNGKALCSSCHLSAGPQPKFTDYSSQNIGIPKNVNNPYFYENANNGQGLVANPQGPAYVDNGLGAVLAGPDNHNPDWKALASNFIGTFQVATVRNVARLPRPHFVRAYMHNGYFTDLKTVVHFYNTRDVLPVCKTSNQKIGVDCWPPPEQPANLCIFQTGALGLNDAEENAIVAFLGTLTDGYFKR